MMKKRLHIIQAAALAIALVAGAPSFGVVAVPNSAITVIVGGQKIDFDQPPQMLNDRVMAQPGPIAEALGWAVEINRSGIYFRAHGELEATPGVYATRYLGAIEADAVWHSDTFMEVHTHHFAGGHYPADSAAELAAIAAGDKCKRAQSAAVAKPVVVNAYTLVALSDVAAALYATTAWDGATKTVTIMGGKLPYYDGEGLPADYKAALQGAATALPPTPRATPAPPKSPAELGFTPTGVMTAAPKVGSVPANILLPGKTDATQQDSYTAPYRYHLGLRMGCNGYAYGRFYETYGYGIKVPLRSAEAFLGDVDEYSAQGWVTDIKAERDLNKIIAGCVAVYVKDGGSGHVVFVEFVERDEQGKPVNVYYTEVMNSDRSGLYKPATDAKVKKVTFERFKKSTSGTKYLVGYVVPAE